MAGFYGRITNGLPAPITLDKIYSNRVNMRDNANTDGIWAGRFVLVNYYQPDNVEVELNPDYYIDSEDEQEIYNKNFLKDKNNGYPNLGTGYDATIWRKVVDRQGTHTYVRLAGLNAIIPVFDLVTEPPGNTPIAPFFDKDDMTSVYYPLHISAGWGFRIANATTTSSGQLLSDYLVETQVDYIKTDDDEIIQVPKQRYNGAIYFNAQGFRSDVTSRVSDSIKNEIALRQVESGNLYGEDQATARDIQELSIILPALGNAVSDMYDLMYGSSNNTPSGKRYTNTTWDDANARNNENRAQSRALTYYKSSMGAQPNGFDPDEAYSLAGTINSVHDMLGMIVTASARPTDAKDAYADQIYYVDYQLTNDNSRNPNKKYYKYNSSTKKYTLYTSVEETWNKNEIYEFVDRYYCVVETPQYHDPIEFETADFNLTPEAFKLKFKDSEISYPSQEYNKPQLVIYTGGKYIKMSDTPSYDLMNAPDTEYGGATPGATYYDIPATLTYAGRMVTSKDNSYYSLNNGTSGKDARPDDNGSWVLISQNDIVLYHIKPNTEYYHVGETYWVLNDEQTEYIRANVDASNFNNFVSNGLYRNGEMSVKLIANDQLGSTGFKVHYVDTGGRDRLQDVMGLGGGNGAYKSHLGSEVDFVEFIRSTLGQMSGVATIDYDYLYIDNSLEPDGQGGYANNYRPYPISRFLFAPLDGDSGYYQDVYKKNGTTYERARVYTMDNVAETTVLRLSFSQETLFTGGWCIQTPPDEMAALKELQKNQMLTSIQTADYTIQSIYWNNIFNPDTIYWTIEGDEAAFTEVGYGVSHTNTAEDDIKEASGKPIYYAPNVLYYKDEADEYVLADDNFVYDGNTTLYRVNELIIVNHGDLEQLRTYSRWDNNLIQSTADIAFFFKPIAEGGHGVQIAHKYMGAVWKDMPGFARNLNTIHGWMIKLNQLFNTGDVRSRDLNTYQGCVNTIKDILAKFGDFEPGGYLHVNRYGQIETVSVVTPDMSGTLSTISASFVRTGTDGLNLALTQSNGVITTFSGSIGAITYYPSEDDGNGGYQASATSTTMTLADALAKISELELRIQALENA